MEDLVDALSAGGSAGFQLHVVVCHGNPTDGLLMPFTRHSPKAYTSTGLVMSAIADQVQRLRHGQTIDEPVLADLSSKMGLATTPQAVSGLVQKMSTLPPSILEIRGCHLGENGPSVLLDYKRAFNALSVSAPTCRMFYVRVRPHKPAHHASMAQVAAASPPANTRRRAFTSGSLPMLVLDVHDIDGHTGVDSDANMDTPSQNGVWAQAIDDIWTGPAEDGFITQVLWNNQESSYHTPFDVSYRTHLLRV